MLCNKVMIVKLLSCVNEGRLSKQRKSSTAVSGLDVILLVTERNFLDYFFLYLLVLVCHVFHVLTNVLTCVSLTVVWR